MEQPMDQSLEQPVEQLVEQPVESMKQLRNQLNTIMIWYYILFLYLHEDWDLNTVIMLRVVFVGEEGEFPHHWSDANTTVQLFPISPCHIKTVSLSSPYKYHPDNAAIQASCLPLMLNCI